MSVATCRADTGPEHRQQQIRRRVCAEATSGVRAPEAVARLVEAPRDLHLDHQRAECHPQHEQPPPRRLARLGHGQRAVVQQGARGEEAAEAEAQHRDDRAVLGAAVALEAVVHVVVVVVAGAVLAEHAERAVEVVLARHGRRPADAPRAVTVVVVVAALHVDRGVARAPPAGLDWQVLDLQADRVARRARRADDAVALAMHQPVGLAREEALVADALRNGGRALVRRRGVGGALHTSGLRGALLGRQGGGVVAPLTRDLDPGGAPRAFRARRAVRGRREARRAAEGAGAARGWHRRALGAERTRGAQEGLHGARGGAVEACASTGDEPLRSHRPSWRSV